MAVAFDAVSTQTTGTGNASWTHTPVGTPTGVMICIAKVDTGSKTISSVTYGGQACTLICSVGTTWAAYIYGLANPPSGAQTVAVNWSGTLSHGAVYDAITVTGGDTTTLVEAGHSATASGSSSSQSVNCTSATDELVVDCVTIAGDNSAFVSLGAGQTERMNLDIVASAHAGRSSTEAGATTVTMSHGTSGTLTWSIAAAAFKASAGGGGGLAIPVAMNQYRQRWN